MANTNELVPASALSLLSPILKQVALWPELGFELELPEPDDERSPSSEAISELEYLTGTWLHASLSPIDFRASFGLCGEGHLTVRLGRTEAQWAQNEAYREERRRRDPTWVEPVRVEGFASAQRHEAFPTFSFALQWVRELGPVSSAALAARLGLVVPEALQQELSTQAAAPQAHPSVHAPSGFAATALLDSSGHGGIFPYLYLYATPDRLVGVFQQVPHTSL